MKGFLEDEFTVSKDFFRRDIVAVLPGRPKYDKSRQQMSVMSSADFSIACIENLQPSDRA
jgi:hypothetical protein